MVIAVSAAAVFTSTATAAVAAPAVPAFEPFGTLVAQSSDETQEAYEKIALMVEQNPDQFTGARIDGPNTITVTAPHGADVSSRIAGLRSGVGVTVQRTVRSYAQLQGTKEKIGALIRGGAHRDGIVGVGVDGTRGVTTVYATGESGKARASLKQRFGDAIVFRQVSAPQFVEADRNRDTAAHFGGAGYSMWNDRHTAVRPYCSTAFPVVLRGVYYMLTAGHCLPAATSFPDAWATAFTSTTLPPVSYYFGTRSTTTMGGQFGAPADGTQDVYGDWALLSGSTYAAYVYNCANVTGSCTAVPVGAASWTTPSVNAGVCTSGRTTGQICRQHVVDATADAWIEGVYVRHLAMFTRDDGGCDTVRRGDSGGAVYQGMSTRPGYQRALGIVTATDYCTSWYTKLSGVRAWNSAVWMPTL